MIQEAREKGVIILVLPAHTTHILQPLDSLFFFRLKVEIRKAKGKRKYQDI